ncbi:peptidoglycan DD-metalloendopeptidase family protein [Erythrobacter sp. JK5]|nr:peptidoglycan DD-metalloendopeptidase family protein [Erythrobacter sp. JK5]
MNHRAIFLYAITAAVLAPVAIGISDSIAQRDVSVIEPDQAQAELQRATRESQRAEARAERFERQAEAATEAADKTAREAAALAARIQSAEADIVAAQARYSLAQSARERLSARLSERRRPLVRLTGALQTTARRPLALSALQPGSLKDVVYVRAVLASAVPQIRERTAALRGELEQGRRLERQARLALVSLRESETDLQARRAELARLETRQRLASRAARGTAVRENERALALAEEARDLDGLIEQIDAAAGLRRELAALPGPVPRPAGLKPADRAAIAEAASVTGDQADGASRETASAAPPGDFQLPVQGRTLTGFGEMRASGLRSTGLSLAPAPGAQIVAPASGRIAFAGPYRGFGQIVIIEHDGGWTSLVTGLARSEVAVGTRVFGGSPLGVAARENPVISVELRRAGEPVNPLRFIG